MSTLANLVNEQKWWRHATIYQIYPKSFFDTTGSGTGDIQGIIQKLDYFITLGVEALWITPMYVSPQIDNGYDIADYYQIDPSYGTMDDFDLLLKEAHQRNLKIIMDIVVNHTSTEHSWFKQAIADPNSLYRDYYIFKPAKDGFAPNNWQSKFGGSAWQKDDKSGEYYLHLFAKEQADLNWENPQVRQEVKNIISFWAEKGVDGFRLDVINLISKQHDFPDDYQGDGRRFYTDGPKIHQYLQEISRDVFQKYGSVTVGEMSSTTIEHCQRYSNLQGSELSMVFNFHHLKVDYPQGEKWKVAQCDFLTLKKLFNDWQTKMHQKGWNALFWCNHDQPRIISRFGDEGKYWQESAKMLAAMIHFMQGTPYIYQGEEIGMLNPHYEDITDYQDIESHNMYKLLLSEGMDKNEVLAVLAQKSRDNSRTPMQWNDSLHAGFTQGKPWLAVANNFKTLNVEKVMQDNDSIFSFYQQLIRLRHQLDVIELGDYQDLAPQHKNVFCYRRKYKNQTLTVVGNFYAQEVDFSIEAEVVTNGEIIANNYLDIAIEKLDTLTLKPYQVVVWLEVSNSF